MPVNGIDLKEGQRWRTRDYGIVTIVKNGLNEEYPWKFIQEGQKAALSITDDGKYWSDDTFPILLELIEETPMKFNPKPGDKIICNNGEEFICCTLGFLQENIAKFISSDKPILGYWKYKHNNTWQDWDEHGNASYDNDNDYDIREVIPQNLESSADKKEEVKEDSLYTVDEVFDAIFETTKHLQIEIPWDYIDDVKEHLSRKNDPQYLEFLRLKAIYD